MQLRIAPIGAVVIACLMAAAGALPSPAPLAAQRDLADPHPLVGEWHGALSLPGARLRLVLHISSGEDGALSAALDSPDQGSFGIPGGEVALSGDSLRVEFPVIGGLYLGEVQPGGERLVGSWSQGPQSFPLELERAEPGSAPTSRRPQEPEGPLPYEVEEVGFDNPVAGIRLAGTLTLPRSERPVPAVVLISGSGPQDRDEALAGHRPFLVLADHLTRRGIAVLRFDDRGVAESEGDFATATSSDFADDALAALAYLRERREVDTELLGLVGHSEGGLVAPLAATRAPGVGFLVLLAAPGFAGGRILEQQGELIARASGAPEAAIERDRELRDELIAIMIEEPDLERADTLLRERLERAVDETDPAELARMGVTPQTRGPFIDLQVDFLNTAWMRFFLTHDPAAVLERVEVPVLAITGENDLQVPPGPNLAAIEAALAVAGVEYQVRELPGLNHLFQTSSTGLPQDYGRIEETFAPAALEVISGWILSLAENR